MSTVNQQIRLQLNRETLLVEPWGSDSLRIRITINPDFASQDWALLSQPASDDFAATEQRATRTATVTHGNLRIDFEASKGFYGFTATRISDGQILIVADPSPRLKSVGGKYCRAELRLSSFEGERFYGLGQHPNGRLDQKGCVIDLQQKNTEIAIPWI